MRAAVLAAQQQVLTADGSLTTLVGAVVCRRARRISGSSSGGGGGGGSGGGDAAPQHALLVVAVGDSPCYVWRRVGGAVQDVTHTPPLHGFHRWGGLRVVRAHHVWLVASHAAAASDVSLLTYAVVCACLTNCALSGTRACVQGAWAMRWATSQT
jgi:hypothetical protein